MGIALLDLTTAIISGFGCQNILMFDFVGSLYYLIEIVLL